MHMVGASRFIYRSVVLGALLAVSVAAQPLSGPRAPSTGDVAVLTQHDNNDRTGANLNETVLNTATVNVRDFGKLFTRAVDGQIYAQPLYVPHLDVPRLGMRNVVFVATMHNSVYAFDADNPTASRPLWHVSLEPPIPLPDAHFDGRFGPFQDIRDAVGIVGTPAIDPQTQTLYAVTASKVGGLYTHDLHALDLATGREKDGGPVPIAASVAVGTEVLIFNSLRELQRPGLLLSDGIVYVAFGSYADADPYHGWVLCYDAQTLRRVCAFTDTPRGTEGGIWQSGQGLAADTAGSVYAITSNGTWDGSADFGNSVLKLRLSARGLVMADWFTPHDQAYLSRLDLDLGSGGVVLLPHTHLLVGGGKQGLLYLLDRDRLGHVRPDDGQAVQHFRASSGSLFSSPVYWERARDPLLFVWGDGDYLQAYRFAAGRFGPMPAARSPRPLPSPAGVPGGVLALSAHGSDPASGIVWAVQPAAGGAGILHAFAAADLRTELWDSTQDPARDALGAYAKFNPPTVANGRVYVGTFSDRLDVYGLLHA